MKEGWSYKKLGEVARVIHGKNQKEVLSANGQYPIYGSGGTIMGYANDFLCEARTTILGRKGSINNPQFIEERFWNVDTAFGITALPGNNSKFIYYFIKSIDWSKKNTGTTLPSLTQQVVISVEIPVPPLSEQHSIVSRLDTAFSHIDALKANAEKQLNEARKLFQAELTECMRPKEGWEEKRIKEVGEVIGGTTPSTTNPLFWGGDIYWISPAELHGEHYLYDSVKKITKEAVEAKSLKELPIGTVILSSRAPIGKIAINKVPMYCNQGFKCVVCKSELYNEYLYWWFYGKKEYLNSLGTGATFLEISKTVVENIIIPIPPLDTQQAVVSHLDSLSSNIHKLEELQQKTIVECDALKQAMLKEVFE